MKTAGFEKLNDDCWRMEPEGAMRVPAILYAGEDLIEGMDDKVAEQLCNVAALPGIVQAAYAMPDAHWGYGFPIGGVAAFDPEEGGVVSAGGVGFDISCGVRTLTTGLNKDELEPRKNALADALFSHVPAGVGSQGAIRLTYNELDRMLSGGARWAVDRGWGLEADLEFVEENGCIDGAEPAEVSDRAKRRQKNEMGTLGSGNHYLEIQYVSRIFDPQRARAFGLTQNGVVVSIHCGSRGLGHQIGTDYLREMVHKAGHFGLDLPDRELACAPIQSSLGQRYLGAMRAGMNCALANREIITHLTREVFAEHLPGAELNLLFDVSHNICKTEPHRVNGQEKTLYVHRKGATRAFGPGHPAVPAKYRSAGQPVIIGGSMGTSSYILAGTEPGETLSFSSACHGAGRAMSRRQAFKRWKGRQLLDELRHRGIEIRSPSHRGVAEEAPGAYKDVSAVVDSAERCGLAVKVAEVLPMVCVKG
ncbi:MAG: RtcB family protein [Xanthomonadales bacterium]|nr:RtcB family protein [Xanthomonadales bacterium]